MGPWRCYSHPFGLGKTLPQAWPNSCRVAPQHRIKQVWISQTHSHIWATSLFWKFSSCLQKCHEWMFVTSLTEKSGSSKVICLQISYSLAVFVVKCTRHQRSKKIFTHSGVEGEYLAKHKKWFLASEFKLKKARTPDRKSCISPVKPILLCWHLICQVKHVWLVQHVLGYVLVYHQLPQGI